MKTSYIQMRISDDMKEEALKIAKDNNMSLSEYVRYLFIKEITKKEIEKEREVV